MVLALEDAIASLDDFPERCPLAPESATFPFEVRQLLYGRKPNVYPLGGLNRAVPEQRLNLFKVPGRAAAELAAGAPGVMRLQLRP